MIQIAHILRVARASPLLASSSVFHAQLQPRLGIDAAGPSWQPGLCSCSYSTAPVVAAASSLSSSQRLPTFSSGPLTLKYPFPIEYLKDREMIVHDMGRRPLRVERLPGQLFNVPVRIDILHRVVRYLRAKWQQGTHKAKVRMPHAPSPAMICGIHIDLHAVMPLMCRTLPSDKALRFHTHVVLSDSCHAQTRGEVSGGRRKPRPQKKTGRSRQGSIRSPLWR